MNDRNLKTSLAQRFERYNQIETNDSGAIK